jgi:hypothetical protein
MFELYAGGTWFRHKVVLVVLIGSQNPRINTGCSNSPKWNCITPQWYKYLVQQMPWVDACNVLLAVKNLDLRVVHSIFWWIVLHVIRHNSMFWDTCNSCVTWEKFRGQSYLNTEAQQLGPLILSSFNIISRVVIFLTCSDIFSWIYIFRDIFGKMGFSCLHILCILSHQCWDIAYACSYALDGSQPFLRKLTFRIWAVRRLTIIFLKYHMSYLGRWFP